MYTRVQSFAIPPTKTRKPSRNRSERAAKSDKNVGDVWKHGGGDSEELTLLYLAMVRDAGFEAYAVYLSDRENYFFDPAQMDAYRLDAGVVLVKFNGKDIYCDPGAAFAPFGLLPWYETGVWVGVWIKTVAPGSRRRCPTAPYRRSSAKPI